MREIKFRAWDKEYGIMDDNLNFPENNYAITPDGKLVRFITGGYPVPDGKMQVMDLSNTHIPMQFTGLKDKNGTESFQHDLISHLDRNGEKPIEIVWKDGSWQGQYVGTDFVFVLNQWEMDSSKVIGNIHQNPELMENK